MGQFQLVIVLQSIFPRDRAQEHGAVRAVRSGFLIRGEKRPVTCAFLVLALR